MYHCPRKSLRSAVCGHPTIPVLHSTIIRITPQRDFLHGDSLATNHQRLLPHGGPRLRKNPDSTLFSPLDILRVSHSLPHTPTPTCAYRPQDSQASRRCEISLVSPKYSGHGSSTDLTSASPPSPSVSSTLPTHSLN